MGFHLLEIEINAEGKKLAYLSPIEENGGIASGFRISGPKPWGGSRTLAKLKISTEDFVRYIRDYAPDVLKEIKGRIE